MIREESKLGIAMDLIEYKIAEVMVKKRECNDVQEINKLEEEFKKLNMEKKEIYAGNIKYIDKIIEERNMM